MKLVSAFGIRLLILFLGLLSPMVSFAQCAMCRATAESSEYSAGINTGVLYLLAFPFLIVFGGGIFWYYNRKKFQANSWD